MLDVNKVDSYLGLMVISNQIQNGLLTNSLFIEKNIITILKKWPLESFFLAPSKLRDIAHMRAGVQIVWKTRAVELMYCTLDSTVRWTYDEYCVSASVWIYYHLLKTYNIKTYLLYFNQSIHLYFDLCWHPRPQDNINSVYQTHLFYKLNKQSKRQIDCARTLPFQPLWRIDHLSQLK